MKIISGKLKGRNIKDYNIEGTRPTQDRVKESVFAIIQKEINNCMFLDLFAGSGSIGFEAISNGADKVYFVDKNKICTNNIKKLASTYNIDNIVIINNDYKKVLNSFKEDGNSFDIIYLDPPYAIKELNSIVEYIVDNEIIKEKGLIILETDELYIKENKNFKIYKNKKYGSTYITILKDINA